MVPVTGVDATSDGFSVSLNFTDANTKAGFNHGGGHANATIKVLTGETIDIRVLVDRPITEIFVNNGRAGHVAVSE